MRNTDPLHHVEHAIENVRNGHLTVAEAAQRIEHCLDLLTDLPADAVRDVHAVVQELQRMRWDGGGDYAAALDELTGRVHALSVSVTERT